MTTSPIFRRRLDATASVQQPAYAGGAAGEPFSVNCVSPVRIATRSAAKFKMATTYNMWETYTILNPAIKAGQVLTVNGQEFTIKFTGQYPYGRSPVLQLILEQQL